MQSPSGEFNYDDFLSEMKKGLLIPTGQGKLGSESTDPQKETETQSIMKHQDILAPGPTEGWIDNPSQPESGEATKRSPSNRSTSKLGGLELPNFDSTADFTSDSSMDDAPDTPKPLKNNQTEASQSQVKRRSPRNKSPKVVPATQGNRLLQPRQARRPVKSTRQRRQEERSKRFSEGLTPKKK